jgi:adhesin transport system outer membrane protein
MARRSLAAPHRVYERSEFIALAVVREYLEYGRLRRVIELAEENLQYHRKVLGDVKKGAQEGTLSVADSQLAQERVYSAEAQLTLAREDLNAAAITFYKLIGIPLDNYEGAPLPPDSMPGSLEDGIGVARQNNPLIQSAEAEVDAAYGVRKQANAELYPKLFLELQGRQGDDLDGVFGRETDLRAELVMRWNLYRGGIDIAAKQAALRRIDEARFILDQAYRDVEETMRLAWNRRTLEAERLAELQSSLVQLNLLVESYLGERTLLDLLNTQNNRFNTEVAVETAKFAVLFADYGILAAAGLLLRSQQLAPPSQAAAYARDAFRVPLTPEGETQKRFSPWEPTPNYR